MAYNTIDGVDFLGKHVFIRVDYNVPTDESGRVIDDRRIQRTLPLLKKLIEEGARIILASHKGRPKGKVVEADRMDGVAKHLSHLLKKDVLKLNDCVGEEVKAAIDQMENGNVVLLENLRFHSEEKSKDASEREAFAKQLAELADAYINEAFANSHRKHASMTGIAQFVPSYAGPSLVKEVETIKQAIEDPQRPFVAILGGKKGDKVSVMQNLLPKVDQIIVAGALGFYFLEQRGVQVGDVKIDLEGVEFPGDLLNNEKLVLPKDAIIAQDFSSEETKLVKVGEIETGWTPFDVGEATLNKYKESLGKAKTVIWAGAIGAYEAVGFSNGTKRVLELVTQKGVTCIVGGGDTAASVEHFGMQDKVTHISTGGGASLKLFAGEQLVALESLEMSKKNFD